MTNRQLIRKYLKEQYPVGTEIYDSTRHGGPYIINKRTVFHIHQWKKENYNPDFLPNNEDDYTIYINVSNPGKYAIDYSVRSETLSRIKHWLENDKNRKLQRKKAAAEIKKYYSDRMLRLFSDFGWKIKTGKAQIYGSVADIYAEAKKRAKYLMLIDDGNCHNALKNTTYHIYVNDLKGKIFEGRINSENDFIAVMRVLEFKKRKNGQ